MILVTVGTHSLGFNRLVQPMDELAGELGEPVIVQRGASTYEPRHAEHFQFTTTEEMAQLMEAARVIVAQASAGTIIQALQLGKPLVVVPRLRQFREHIDDHQLQLARAMSKQSKAIAVYELSVTSLRAAIAAVGANTQPPDGPQRLIRELRKLLGGDLVSPAHSLRERQRAG